jgi:hypothetical protein
VLLADGSRLIAVARYGLCDQTPSRRRGCLEFFGVVAPGGLSASSSLAVYRWLRERRVDSEDLRTFGGRQMTADFPVFDFKPSGTAAPFPVLPVRLWEECALLFAATSAADPDNHLVLLERDAPANWQWLPLVGPDFPLQTYLRQGPLIAWTPHLLPVAVQVQRHTTGSTDRPTRHKSRLLAALGVFLILLSGANLWATLSLPSRLQSSQPSGPVGDERRPGSPRMHEEKHDSAERFAQALYRLMTPGDFSPRGKALLDQYQILATQDTDLRISSKEGKAVVVGVQILSRRQIKRIDALVREALSQKKGYDPELVDLACKRIREHLTAGVDRGSR